MASFRVLLALSFFGFTGAVFGADRFKVTVSRDDSAVRQNETIAVPMAVFRQYLPNTMIDHIEVTAGNSSQSIPYQVTNFSPEEHRDNYLELLFQHDFATGEKQVDFWVTDVGHAVPPFPSRVSARYVPERFDDFAWENDRIGHRIYGPGLDTPAAGGGRMAASGIDVWCKRVRYPIVDRWYLKGHYHEDSGEGLDMYDVGRSRGAGGGGVWDGKMLHPSGNWKFWRVLANGPLRTVFEIGYGPWDAGPGLTVSEVKRFTVDAGHNLDQIEDTYTFAGATQLTVGLGLAKHANVKASIEQEPSRHWLLQWESFAEHGSIGEAVLLPPETAAQGFTETPTDHLLLLAVKSGQPVRYFAGAGWDQSGDFPNAESWSRYLALERARAENPLRLSYSVN